MDRPHRESRQHNGITLCGLSQLTFATKSAQSGHSKHRLRPVRDGLRDRNDLKLLTGCANFIPNSSAHQKPCHWGYEGNRTGLRVRFLLSHDTIMCRFKRTSILVGASRANLSSLLRWGRWAFSGGTCHSIWTAGLKTFETWRRAKS
jgi:hypothetical protein